MENSSVSFATPPFKRLPAALTVITFAIQELNTGEGTTIPQKAASAWKKYELQNQGQAGQITTPQSDESGNNGVTTVDGNGNAASDENKTNTQDDVQVEPEQDGNNTLS